MIVESRVVQEHNLFNYFQPLVKDALQRHKPDTEAHTEFYLVKLLDDFSRTAKAFEGMSPKDPALGVQLTSALNSTPSERYSLLKRVGDYTLYMCGFYTMGLNLRLVDVNYYKGIGRRAYHHLAQSPCSGDLPLTGLFKELACHFEAFVSVLGLVSDANHTLSHSDMIRLYEEWLSNGSSWAMERLRRHGLPVPPRGQSH